MGPIIERAKALLAEPGGWGRIGFYTWGQLAFEDYYTLGVIAKAGIGRRTSMATPDCAPPRRRRH